MLLDAIYTVSGRRSADLPVSLQRSLSHLPVVRGDVVHSIARVRHACNGDIYTIDQFLTPRPRPVHRHVPDATDVEDQASSSTSLVQSSALQHVKGGGCFASGVSLI